MFTMFHAYKLKNKSHRTIIYKTNKTENNNYCQGMVGMKNGASFIVNSMEVPEKVKHRTTI